MLSRIAESLYWIGRYLERADNTARILEVEVQTNLENPPEGNKKMDERSANGSSSSSASPTSTVVEADYLAMHSLSLGHPTSILSSVISARENARGAREVISSELWECLNVTQNQMMLTSVEGGSLSLHQFFQFTQLAKERVALAYGIVDSTMIRDDAWYFFTIGVFIERIDMTVRLIGTRDLESEDVFRWITMLKSCSAYQAFIRIYGGIGMDRRSVLEFLVLDRGFPRSIYFSLCSVGAALEAISDGNSSMLRKDIPFRLLGRLKGAVEYLDGDDLALHIGAHLAKIQRETGELSIAISNRFFYQDEQQQWRSGRN